MANPFTEPFNCCTCPEPPDYDPEVDDPLDTYVNLCGCPTVDIECVSEEKDARLCGFNEYPGYASSPPKKYKIETLTHQETEAIYTCVEPCNQHLQRFSVINNYTATKTYDPADCDNPVTDAPGRQVVGSQSQLRDVEPKDRCSKECSPGFTIVSKRKETYNTTDVVRNQGYTSPFGGTASSGVLYKQNFSTVTNFIGSAGSCTFCEGKVASSDVTSREWALSSEDTEADALARATPTAGTSCTSIYELRTESFSFTVRTATYTATASNLVVGVQYEGCVRIRRREAYSGTVPSGADTAWYDVEPDTIAAFTATATEEEVATDVALPNVQGYEYEVGGAYVWPTSAGCDCPTSYVAP